MKLHVLPAGPLQTNAYLITAPERGEAVLIDAPGGIWPLVEPRLAADGCRLTELWITHGHWDHIQDAAVVVAATKAKVTAHAADEVLLKSPGMMMKFLGRNLQIDPVVVDRWVAQGDRIEALGLSFEVRHVPGHCPGNILFYVGSSAFVGDALFAGSVGRTDLPGGNREELEESVRQQIYTLPDETKVYPGHGPATTVGHERATNPYVRG
ncbi:MAG TPA: MBL fold metallo-hydrolase [Opitutaceae bacterium]